MSLSGGMMVLRAMVLGWLDGLFTAIHERVLYPSHRLVGGEGNYYLAERKPPPPLFYSVDTELPRMSEPVEKVVVGPVGGPKEARNKAKTLHKRSF